jgi:hypothetical protein
MVTFSFFWPNSTEGGTSAEVNSRPVWNLTPWRSLSVSVLPSGEKSHFSASSGCTRSSAS